MGTRVKVITSRDKLYDKNYKREQLIKLNENIDITNESAYEFLYLLLQNNKNSGGKNNGE